MPDTETAPARVTFGPHRRLTEAAATRVVGLADTDEGRARTLGVSRSAYYRMLKGTTDISLGRAYEIAEQLGLSLDQTWTA